AAQIASDYPGNDQDAIRKRFAALNIVVTAFDQHVGDGPDRRALTPAEQTIRDGYADAIRNTGHGMITDQAAFALQQDSAFAASVLNRYFSGDAARDAIAQHEATTARQSTPAPAPASLPENAAPSIVNLGIAGLGAALVVLA